MKKTFSVVSLCALVSFALLVSLQTGCKPAKPDEVPITTKSEEARELFIEGRNLAEYFHTEKANDVFKRAVETDPEFAMGYLFLAGTSAETKDFQDAMAKAISLAPNVSEGEQKIIAGFQARNAENNDLKANQIYQELVALFPNDKRIHWYLASTYGRMQEYDKQLAELENAIALDKNFAPAYESLGYFYRWRNQFDKAEEAFKEYVRLSPQEPNAYDLLGDLYMRMGKFEEAIGQYNEAIALDSTHSYAQYMIGSTLAFMGRYEDARQAFLKTMDMQLKPANKVYDQEGIMRTYVYEGDYAKALEAADKAIQMAGELGLPEQASFDHIVKSAICCELGDYEEADASLADCLSFLESADLVAVIKENQKAGATLWQAVVATGRQDFAAAQAKADEYKTLVDAIENPAVKKYPGWLFGYIALVQGDAAKAVELLGQGEMDHPWFMYYFAVAKEKAGDAAGAAELYKKVADWNLDSVWYAFVRSKASAKM
jgi:tetratricopeptide (TPR) repeat protein